MILYKYILKNHFVPFLFSIITLMFIFLLQFMMKFADRLIGKGLDTWVIIKLITFNLAWMLVLVVPMASLVSTLMAFGTLSQNNEVTIMKSTGISLYKMMIAPLIAGLAVGYLLLLFNNDVLPDANHYAKVLMQDISRQKPTLSLEPGVFSQEVSNYAILVRDINKNTNELSHITIYDYTDPYKINIVTAEKGRIYFAKDQSKLIMDLSRGEIHETGAGQTNLYRKLVFQKHRIAMNADQFSFQQSTPGGQRGDRELSSSDMMVIVDSLKKDKAFADSSMYNEVKNYMLITDKSEEPGIEINTSSRELVYSRAIEEVKTAKNVIVSSYKRAEGVQDEINKYMVEVHKKYALPAACLIFVLIGAPLGVMVKKGGFGTAASISLFFFLIYWAFLIGGEKLADRNMLTPFWGMWAANVVLAVMGILLTIRAAKEAVVIKFDFLKKLLPKQWKDINESTQTE